MSLLPCIEIAPQSAASAAIIWLHGLGASGHDFVSIVPELKLPTQLPVRFIFPHAPARPITINNGYVMPAWYDIRGIDFEREPDRAGVVESAQAIAKLIEQEEQRGIAANRIVLAGFSQGGAMAIYTGLRYPRKLAGIMSLSAYLLDVETLPQERQAANQTTSLFVAHGQYDPLVPYALGEQTATVLRSLNYSVEFKNYPLEHSVCLEEIGDIATWLQTVLK